MSKAHRKLTKEEKEAKETIEAIGDKIIKSIIETGNHYIIISNSIPFGPIGEEDLKETILYMKHQRLNKEKWDLLEVSDVLTKKTVKMEEYRKRWNL